MATSSETFSETAISALSNGSLSESQARQIYLHGEEVVVFALFELAKQLAEAHGKTDPSITPSTPSAMIATYKKPHAKRLIKRLRRHRDELLTFLDRPNVPFDNNHAERSIRPVVIIRKNSYGNRSEQGADCQAVLMSVFRTLKQRNQDPNHTVIDSLTNYLTTGKLPPLPKPTSDG